MGHKEKIGHLVFELTEACNQKCSFCYNHWRPIGYSPTDEHLASRTLNRLLRQTDIECISFSGGEPTLLKNIHDFALKCRFNGTSVNILTNGTLVSDDDIDIFKNIGISTVQIPLLSNNPEIHNYLTSTQDSWEKAYKTICSVLKTLGPEHFAAVLIVTARNLDGIVDTLNLYRDLGVKKIMVNRFNIGGNGLRNLKELCLTKEQLNNAFKLISDFSVRNAGMDFVSGVCTPVCVLDPFDFPGIRFSNCSLDIRNRPITVSYKGDVRFCNHSPFVLGNIWERNLRDILYDETNMKRYVDVPQECESCELFSRCKGGCRAASEQMYGTFGRVDPLKDYLQSVISV